jgi:heme-degrading monooxygenase HmoA
MYGRLFSLQVKPGRMDELITKWNDEMVPVARAQNGWLGARLLVDRATGKAVVVGFWATEADAVASGAGSQHAERQRALVADLVTGPPVIETLEVAGEHMP